jgi:hypothetical protein
VGGGVGNSRHVRVGYGIERRRCGVLGVLRGTHN